MSEELKSCPFCGVHLVFRTDEDGVYYMHGLTINAPCIIGTLCVEMDMVDQWNRRAEPKGEK